MVYELARQWQVEVLDDAFGAIEELHSRLDQVADLVGDIQVCAGDRREHLEKQLGDLLEKFAGKTAALGWTIRKAGAAKPAGEGLGPRSVLALLKKIRKRYGPLEGVADEINRLVEKTEGTPAGGLVGRILRTRNLAAHADVEGRHQETDEATVTVLLGDFAVVLLRLSNVAEAIRLGGPQAG